MAADANVGSARRRARGTIAAASALFLLACLAGYGGLLSHAYPGDVLTYALYGREWVNGGLIPYHTFYVEYPPGVVPLFALPVLLWNAHYVLVFKLLMAACGLGLVACSAWIATRLELSPLRLVPVALAPLLLGPVFLNRYDPFATLLSTLALVALLRGRDALTGALLGAGTAVKLYAAIFVPLTARRLGSWKRAAVAFVVAAAVLVVPWFAVSPGGVGYSLWKQIRRHLQIESLGASILLAVSKLGIHHVGWIDGEPGSIDLGGLLANGVSVLASLLSVAAVLLAAWLYWRGPDTDARLVTAWACAITGFVIFGKVLSPQYLTWLVPLVPLAAGRKGRWAAILFAALLLLTQFEYLADRYGLRRQDAMVWVLLLRNGGLVAVFALLAAQLRETQTRV